jgi:hypothetical protein
MGIWKMIKTMEDVAELQRVMDAPIQAWCASDLLNNILGDDSLCDHFAVASAINKDADVRSLIVNRIDQLFFTETPAEDICGFEVAAILKSYVDNFKLAEDDIFFTLLAVKDEGAARQPVMWVRDDSNGDPTEYLVKHDAIGLDYVVIAPDDQVYRVEAIHACVVAFHPEHAARYHAGSASSLTMN